MDPIITVIAVIAALILGAGLGWMLAKRGGDDAKAAVELLRMQLESVTRERDEAKAEMAAVRGEMQGLRDRAEYDRSELASLKSGQEERNRAYEARIAELREVKELSEKALAAANEEARKALSAQFSEIGGKLLGEAQKNFLERADQRFHQQGERNEEKIRQLLAPVGERLKSYEEQVGKIEKERTEAYGTLTGLIGEMKEGQQRVQSEAAKIVNSLRAAPKTSGRWGEQQFENLLEVAGLKKGIDFKPEVSVQGEDGVLRPDYVIMLPGDQQLIVDIKCPLDAYMEAVGEADPQVRQMQLNRHAAAIRGHAAALGKKAYWSQFDKAPDYVVLYVPGDNFLSAALEADMSLWEDAARNRVLVSGPATFFPLARTIANMWRQQKLNDDARKIADHARKLYDDLALAAERYNKLGRSLTTAVRDYNEFSAPFGRLAKRGSELEELGVERGKRKIEPSSEVASLPSPAEIDE
ncbi:DNA recombination protein RmuC [Novosphingopyxis iocasae]|uniref:DNA recombination protein RmuC n=1 Tax=Novosphingopyxis iocasae TaxID=2762729 RepID=UPI001FEC14E5|nr:DNA recombination protein RmuC [Novosphingopyxis iocasae]